MELDEEPPHKINEDALKIALQVCLLLNAKVLPITQIMRKTVVDGSNTSGFQRTILIAQDGYLETTDGKIRIDTICLEEDAARIIEKNQDQTIYRLDRLGIPLIEISTSPDIKTPEQAKEVASLLGDILRSCKVKRGIGTIRQDVNMSIKGHPRVEIKGFQDLRTMPKILDFEIERQIELKDKGKTEVRKALIDGKTEFLRPMPGADRMYPETDLPLLKISRNLINEIKKNLPKLKSEIHGELKEKGLNEEMIKLILKNNLIEEFKELLDISPNPNLIAKMLVIFPKEIMIKENADEKRIEKMLNRESLIYILEELKKGKISESQIKEIMIRVVKGTRIQDAVLFKKQDSNEVEEFVMKLIKEKPGLSEKAYMGLIMKEFKGRVDGKRVREIVGKYIN